MILNKSKYIIVLVTATLISSCGLVTKKYSSPEIATEKTENLYRDHQTTDSTTIADIKWSTYFSDPLLQGLIEKALANNYDFQNAVLSIGASENLLKQSKLAFLPSLNFAPTITQNFTSKNSLNFPSNVNINLKTTVVSLGFNTNWEIEVWGKMTAAKRSAYANFMSSEANKRALQTSLVATVADMYYTLMSLDKQLEITESTIKIRARSVEALQALMDAGAVTGADVVQAEANLYAAQVTVPEIKQAIREIENALCVLLAQSFQKIERSSFDAAKLPTELLTGVPAQLLANRPDVEAAEWDFRRAFEQTNVARTSFYPSLTLTSGTGGISALTTRALFDSNAFFGQLIAGITQPIFQRGVLKTNYRNAIIAQQQALNNFEKAMLVAGQEVTNALYAYEVVQEKKEARRLQVEALEKAVEFRMALLEYSSNTNYTDVLTSEQLLIAAQFSQVNDQLTELKSQVSLYRALGGGWK